MKIHFEKGTYAINALETIPEFAKASNSVIAHGPGLSKKNEAFAFTSETGFRNWIGKSTIGKQLEPLFKKIAKARSEGIADLAFVKKRQLAKAERIEKDLRQLAKETGLKYGSRELFLRATRDSRILEGHVFDPASLYTGANFTGNSIGAAVPLPDLTWWPGMNNSITSAQVLGVCVLFRQTLFRGGSLWLVGAPYMQVASLAGTGFNNAASSAYVYLY